MVCTFTRPLYQNECFLFPLLSDNYDIIINARNLERKEQQHGSSCQKGSHQKNRLTSRRLLSPLISQPNRVLYNFTEDELKSICNHVEGYIRDHHMTEIQIWQMHNIVESALESVRPEVAKSYRDYRNYKQDFVGMLDSVYQKSQSIMYIGDKENSNTDSALVSTKRSLIFNQLNKELYQKFFMNTEELQACRDGYIYVHDMSARRDTMNCCLFDVASVLKDGFEMGNQ